MKKRAFLIHGWEGYPEEGWRPWLKQELEEKGFTVVVPSMPDTENPKIKVWVSHLAKIVGTPNKTDYFVGHSLGCITILRYFETLKDNQKVGGSVLVAGFAHDLEYDGYKGELSSFFQTAVNWEKIKKHCNKFIAIHSDDDPWVPVKHSKIYKEKLGAKAIVMHKMKHFSGDDGITQLPIVLDSVLKLSQ
ncbi:MAG: alpha/beta hydrolase [Candidatus Levybacteria bacterium]|nr:alpha/beta hydrolase [Candidatus Levybacteria bacterium]